MKTIVIGDIHGRTIWKQIVRHNTFDKVVFEGDYFDSFDISVKDQLKNFNEIIKFKERFPDKVVLLIGN